MDTSVTTIRVAMIVVVCAKRKSSKQSLGTGTQEVNTKVSMPGTRCRSTDHTLDACMEEIHGAIRSRQVLATRSRMKRIMRS